VDESLLTVLPRAAAALRAGDLQQAERDVRLVLSRDPADAQALNLAGAVAFAGRNWPEAERHLTAALAADSNSDDRG
jgi:Flp pilus assembly protein TadD